MALSFDKPLLMGILNITPDSFSDGGKFLDHRKAQEQLQQLIEAGADILDVGAESTFGPEAQITAGEEWARLEPILSSVDFSKVIVSVDTWKAPVAKKALQLGVHMINDVTALRGDPGLIDVLLKYQPYVCLMHSAYSTPYAGRELKHYEDVMQTIVAFLQERTDLLISRGFPREKIIVDPGLGFFLSADPQVSWEVIDRLGELKALGFPILVGPSMKSFLGGEIQDRLPRTLEASQKCLANGANILRVHDVKEHAKLLPFHLSHG